MQRHIEGATAVVKFCGLSARFPYKTRVNMDEPTLRYRAYKPSSKIGLEQMLETYARHKQVVRRTPSLMPYVSDTVHRIVSLIQRGAGRVAWGIGIDVQSGTSAQLDEAPYRVSMKQCNHVLTILRNDFRLGVSHRQAIADSTEVVWDNLEKVIAPMAFHLIDLTAKLEANKMEFGRLAIEVAIADGVADQFDMDGAQCFASWQILKVLCDTGLYVESVIRSPGVLLSTADEQERLRLFVELTQDNVLRGEVPTMVGAIVRAIYSELDQRYGSRS